MIWKQDSTQWVCGLFKIVNEHRHFKLYYNRRLIEKFESLKQAQDEAENILQQ